MAENKNSSETLRLWTTPRTVKSCLKSCLTSVKCRKVVFIEDLLASLFFFNFFFFCILYRADQ